MERGICSVCSRDVAVGANGWPARPHNRTVDHNPEAEGDAREVITSPCRGSNRPALAAVEAFEAARAGTAPLHG